MPLVVLILFELTVSLCLNEVERFTDVVNTLRLGLANADQANTAALQWITQKEDSALLRFQILTDILDPAHVEECFLLDHG